MLHTKDEALNATIDILIRGVTYLLELYGKEQTLETIKLLKEHVEESKPKRLN